MIDKDQSTQEALRRYRRFNTALIAVSVILATVVVYVL